MARMTTALKSTALKNRILANVRSSERGDYDFRLRNQSAGDSEGCSGFIQNTATGKIVYITTDVGGYAAQNIGTCMFRVAESLKDFSGKGGRNTWGSPHDPDYIDTILHHLR